MSKYVISDLHGCYDKFMQMLNLINLSSNDILYILGDVIDRGDKSLEIIDYIIGKNNIIWLKGNHEKFLENYVESDYRDIYLWMLNGGSNTYNSLLKKGQDYINSLYKYVKRLPLIKVVDKFILVHAGLYFPINYNKLSLKEFINLQEEDICLWDRSNIGDEKQFKDYAIVCGHTPVQTIQEGKNAIIRQNGTVYVDCGCAFDKGQLSCLRLDDMKEFYI